MVASYYAPLLVSTAVVAFQSSSSLLPESRRRIGSRTELLVFVEKPLWRIQEDTRNDIRLRWKLRHNQTSNDGTHDAARLIATLRSAATFAAVFIFLVGRIAKMLCGRCRVLCIVTVDMVPTFCLFYEPCWRLSLSELHRCPLSVVHGPLFTLSPSVARC